MTLDDLEKRLLGLALRDGSLQADGTVRPWDPGARLLGRDQPQHAVTHIGLARLRSIRTALTHDIPGHVLETGVGRGGAVCYASQVLKGQDRRVLAVAARGVLNDAQARLTVQKLPFDTVSWCDIWPAVPPLALLRLGSEDGPQTAEALQQAYSHLAPGGWVMVDWYGRSPACRAAVDAFRRRAWVSTPLRDIDGTGVFWRVPGPDLDEPATPPSEPPLLAPRAESGPLLSVIVPAHERPQYLGQCLDSIVSQADDDMEVLVCDDASSFDVESVVRALGDPRLRYVRRPANIGQWPNINEGLRASRGRWIHTLHDDDYVLSGFYRMMRVAAMAVPDTVGVLCCGCLNRHETDGSLNPLPHPRDTPGLLSDWPARLAVDNPLNHTSVVVHRAVYETVGLYDESYSCADWEFYLRSSVRYDWWYEPQYLAVYRVHDNSISHRSWANGVKARSLRRTIETAARLLPPAAVTALRTTRFQHAARILLYAVAAFEAGEFDTATRLIQEAYLLNPRWA